MKPKHSFIKDCKRCGKIFKPFSRHNFLCEECLIEKINLSHLKRLRGSLSSFIQRNNTYTHRDYVKKVLEFAGFLDVIIKKLGEKNDK